MESLLLLIGKAGMLSGFVAVVVEWSVNRHFQQLKDELAVRDKQIDKRFDLLEIETTRIESTVDANTKYLERTLDGITAIRDGQGDRQR